MNDYSLLCERFRFRCDGIVSFPLPSPRRVYIRGNSIKIDLSIAISRRSPIGAREIIVHNYSHRYWCFSRRNVFPFFFFLLSLSLSLPPVFLYSLFQTPLNFNYYVTKGYKRYREAIRYGIVIFGEEKK